MIINALEYLELAQEPFGNKVLYKDENEGITFSEALDKARKVGSMLASETLPRKPVIVLADKSVWTPIMYFGVLYSGCFYVPIGTDLPVYRMNLITETVNADLMLVDDLGAEIVKNLDYQGKVIRLDEALNSTADLKRLDDIRRQAIDVDPAYIIFTSGSTGRPKGVVESHRQLIDYIESFSEAFDISDDEILGNQAPLDYIAAVRDIYLPLKNGASTVLIKKQMFSFPHKLFAYLNDCGVTTICWVVGAMSLCVEMKAFEKAKLDYVRKVFFTGSVMPCKYLRVWQENLPDALYVNHYGPTEITASCTYYIVDHMVNDDETLPIGVPFRNTGILLLTEDGREAAHGERGEICVRGTSLALGYYENPEKTGEAFTLNPCNKMYDEIIYRTGDIGIYNDAGQLEFLGRKDHQIKHMGHRVELGDIENTAMTIDSIRSAVCLYDSFRQQIWLFYTGDIEVKDLAKQIREKLPSFMVPRKYEWLEELPQNFNGKTDMNKLRKRMG